MSGQTEAKSFGGEAIRQLVCRKPFPARRRPSRSLSPLGNGNETSAAHVALFPFSGWGGAPPRCSHGGEVGEGASTRPENVPPRQAPPFHGSTALWRWTGSRGQHSGALGLHAAVRGLGDAGEEGACLPPALVGSRAFDVTGQWRTSGHASGYLARKIPSGARPVRVMT